MVGQLNLQWLELFLKVNVSTGASIAQGDVVLIMEAMKMETEVRSKIAGVCHRC